MEDYLRNRAKCLTCGAVIESKYTHDFVRCPCGKLAVDGGPDYARRVYSGPWTNIDDNDNELGDGGRRAPHSDESSE